MADRVYMHVGTPKSGTTYLQAVLWHNKARLKSEGVLLPAHFQAHYAAAKGVTSRVGRRRETHYDIDDSWALLARRLNRWRGRGLVSHELFAPARLEQVEVAMAALRRGEVALVPAPRAPPPPPRRPRPPRAGGGRDGSAEAGRGPPRTDRTCPPAAGTRLVAGAGQRRDRTDLPRLSGRLAGR